MFLEVEDEGVEHVEVCEQECCGIVNIANIKYITVKRTQLPTETNAILQNYAVNCELVLF